MLSATAATVDPIVRVAMRTQRYLALTSGTVLSLVAGMLLVASSLGALARPIVMVAGLALCGSLVWRVRRRYGALEPDSAVRLEIEIGTHAAVLLYALVLELPGGLEGTYHPIVYVLVMWGAGVLSRPAMALTLAFAAGLEVAVGWLATDAPISAIATHVVLLAVFAVLNLIVFRSEIARVRRLSKEKIASELSRVSEAARSYRLVGSGKTAVDFARAGIAPPTGDEASMVHSSIEHLQQSLQFMLFLLRKSCGLKTAALLWLDDDGTRFYLREASSSAETLLGGPFSAKEGIFAAALETGRPVTLSGSKARGRMPLYAEERSADCVCAVPLAERGAVVGMLLVDFEAGVSCESAARASLMDAATFALRSVENERLFLQLEKAKIEQGKLYRAADLLAEARTEVEVIRAGVDSAKQFTAFDFAAVTLFHLGSNTHEICAVSGESADLLVGETFPDNTGLVAMVVKNQHPLPYRGVYQASHHLVFNQRLRMPPMPSLIVLPLVVHGSALGTLMLGSHTPGAFSDELRPTLEVLSRHVAVSLANARLVKRLEDLATTDSMTGLLNKRALTETAREKIRAAARFARPLTLMVGDIDFFKKVNDTYGHDVGDVVIKGFGEVLKRCKRATDSVGRFGGEEFVLVCEETDAAGAQLLAERIRQELEVTKFETAQGTVQVTCSLGVATFPSSGHDWESLFKATDEALYVSKRGGRNRVTSWTPAARGAAA